MKHNIEPNGSAVSALRRNNVRISGNRSGSGARTLVLAHGYGCDQAVWHRVAEAFAPDHQVITFDHVGAGDSDLACYDPDKYATLDGYCNDLLEICTELQLRDIVFVGHSVSAMIGVLAALRAPDMFERLVLVGPSPCYIDDGDYVGGFARRDIEELLDLMDSNFVHWSSTMAPVIMQNPERPELAHDLSNSFCRLDPEVARQFARVTFLSDNRAQLPLVRTPALILQCRDDAIAPLAVGDYMHRQMAGSVLRLMRATGHCPHISAPDETVAAIRDFLDPAVPHHA